MDSNDIKAIADREKYIRPGKVIAFAALYMGGDYPYHIRIAELGTAGHAGAVYPIYYTDMDAAHDCADNLNSALGLDEATAIAIVADTMDRSRRKQREEEVDTVYFHVKVEFSKPENRLSVATIEMEQLMAEIESAIEYECSADVARVEVTLE